MTTKRQAKHGFYGGLFDAQDRRLLGAPLRLEDEQKLLRVRVYRLAQRLNGEMELKEELSSVTALLRMIQAIATLERVNLLLRGRGDETDRAVIEALGEIDPFEEL